jgi:hypothetical protein
VQPEIFAFSLDREDSLAFCNSGNVRGILRFCRDGVQDVDAANPSLVDQWAQRSSDGFYFW